jgi:hypothetical protein
VLTAGQPEAGCIALIWLRGLEWDECANLGERVGFRRRSDLMAERIGDEVNEFPDLRASH